MKQPCLISSFPGRQFGGKSTDRPGFGRRAGLPAGKTGQRILMDALFLQARDTLIQGSKVRAGGWTVWEAP